MKKWFRLFLATFVLSIFSFGIWTLYFNTKDRGLTFELEADPSLYILLTLILFAVPSFVFNLEKLYRKQKTELYVILRYGDLLFSSFLCFSTLLGLYRLRGYNNTIKVDSEAAGSFEAMFIFLTALCVMSLLLIIDHFRFHKVINRQKKTSKIEDIGAGT